MRPKFAGVKWQYPKSEESSRTGQTAIVTGHYMFWPEVDDCGQRVMTFDDLKTYTHILYLTESAEQIALRRLNDEAKARPVLSAKRIERWQEAEIEELRCLCRLHHILFSLVSWLETPLDRVSALIRYFRYFNAETNVTRAQERLLQVLPDLDRLETVLVLDADKTLAAEDSGELFWKLHAPPESLKMEENPLKILFGSHSGYSEFALLQAALLYDEVAPDNEYELTCSKMASCIDMYPEFISLLRSMANHDHVGVVVVTCGLSRVWEKVLNRHGLSPVVQVVGAGRTRDGLTVTPAIKASFVSRLRMVERLHVMAFGDSPLDLPMLQEANEAIVLVGDARTRSQGMDAALAKAIDEQGLRARQVLIPGTVPARLDDTKLPQVKLFDHQFIGSIIRRRSERTRVLHATGKKAAWLLMSPTRDANLGGPQLRTAHRNIGRYVATEYLPAVVGLEEYPITHVQGHQTSGYRLRNEHLTSIIAIMRAGEALAFGINDVLPHAMFIHAGVPANIQAHIVDQRTVILVDSVVNSGETVHRFIEHLRRMSASVRIIVVASVVQAETLKPGRALAAALERHDAKLITLRLSNKKFIGTKSTDTGNRLFNTVHLP